ncbi:MAG: HAD-IIB family hydrolase [Deltaproteobacteria bacterium]|nr:HAD-IIB family hydrolase [Deltaproteobacteria bacterium]
MEKITTLAISMSDRKGPASGGNDTPFIVIFTDLDGTLLDHHSYAWDKAKPALDTCRRHHVPVIMVSSKTRAEMDVLRKKLNLPSPFISENGGGIFFPKKCIGSVPPGTVFVKNIWKWSIGTPYEILVQSLREIREKLGWKIRGFSDMTPEEISHLTGLDLVSSRLAAIREYDEPFMILEQDDKDIDALFDAAKQRELQITEGGRFYHIHGKTDKGAAVKKVISWYEESYPQVFTIALGDSPNDFSMLKQVDHPILIRSKRDFPEIAERFQGMEVTRETGPEGWNSAVLEILGKIIKGGIS